jgi:ADP-ribose pyrophosphatase
MQTWKTLARRTILDFGKWLKVENHTVQLPDGALIDDWAWIITPDYVNVVAVTPDDRWLVFRQPKYAVDGLSLAPVGGYIEPGEIPLEAAKRELLEETGYAAPDWINLGDYVVDGNRGAGTAHLFLARAAHRVAQPNADDLEEQEQLLLTRAEVIAALDAAEFRVVSWMAAVALALLKADTL